MSQEKSKLTKMRNGSKALIIFSLLLFAATPFVLIYSPKLFYWIECGGKPDQVGAGWHRCGGLGFQYIFYDLGLVLILLAIGALLMLYATRSRKAQ